MFLPANCEYFQELQTWNRAAATRLDQEYLSELTSHTFSWYCLEYLKKVQISALNTCLSITLWSHLKFWISSVFNVCLASCRVRLLRHPRKLIRPIVRSLREFWQSRGRDKVGTGRAPLPPFCKRRVATKLQDISPNLSFLLYFVVFCQGSGFLLFAKLFTGWTCYLGHGYPLTAVLLQWPFGFALASEHTGWGGDKELIYKRKNNNRTCVNYKITQNKPGPYLNYKSFHSRRAWCVNSNSAFFTAVEYKFFRVKSLFLCEKVI
jgi:hypothetical protein